MPEFLSLYAHPSDDIMGLCPYGRRISWGKFYDDVQIISSHIDTPQIVLACSDIYNFTTAFMALVHIGANIILPSNMQTKTLQDITNEEDSRIFNDSDIEEFLKKAMLQPAIPSTKKSQITLYTSGSSGVPTAIKKPLSALEAEVKIFHEEWGVRVKGGVFASSVAHYHAYGLPFYVLWALYSGSPMALQQIGYPEELEYYANFFHINFIAAPAFFKRHYDFFKVNDNKIEDVSHLKFVTSAGSPLPSDWAQSLAKILPAPVVEIYGSTETGAIASRSWSEENWTCLDGVTINCEENEHICVSSPAIGQDEDRVLQDCVEIFENGHFVLLGRSDRIVKIFGKRVSIDLLEARCSEHEWVNEVRMVILSSSERLGAVVTLTEKGKSYLEYFGKREVTKALRTYLLESFDLVTLPRKWRFVDEIPTNNMGKIHNKSLLGFFDDK